MIPGHDKNSPLPNAPLDFVSPNGEWDWQKLQSLIPTNMCNIIRGLVWLHLKLLRMMVGLLGEIA